jgi:hypothetical protein
VCQDFGNHPDAASILQHAALMLNQRVTVRRSRQSRIKTTVPLIIPQRSPAILPPPRRSLVDHIPSAAGGTLAVDDSGACNGDGRKIDVVTISFVVGGAILCAVAAALDGAGYEVGAS